MKGLKISSKIFLDFGILQKSFNFYSAEKF